MRHKIHDDPRLNGYVLTYANERILAESTVQEPDFKVGIKTIRSDFIFSAPYIIGEKNIVLAAGMGGGIKVAALTLFEEITPEKAREITGWYFRDLGENVLLNHFIINQSNPSVFATPQQSLDGRLKLNALQSTGIVYRVLRTTL